MSVQQAIVKQIYDDLQEVKRQLELAQARIYELEADNARDQRGKNVYIYDTPRVPNWIRGRMVTYIGDAGGGRALIHKGGAEFAIINAEWIYTK